MFSTSIRTLVSQQWAGLIALFLVLSGGSAWALDGSNTVFSDDIVNGQVKAGDVDNGAVGTSKIADNQVKTADIGSGEVKTSDLGGGAVDTAKIADGQVRSSDVANDQITGGDVAQNSLKGADIDETTLDVGDGARAYALVEPFNCDPGPFAPCTPDLSKGISSVIRSGTGVYCVTAPGISALETPAAVTVDWTSSTDGAVKSAMAMSESCGPGGTSFRVTTQRLPEITVDAGGGVNNATAYGPDAELDNDVGFTIVIP